MTRATWNILDHGKVTGPGVHVIVYNCPGCGHEAKLPVLGLALAQCGGGILFDIGTYAMPTAIRCRQCRRAFTST